MRGLGRDILGDCCDTLVFLHGWFGCVVLPSGDIPVLGGLRG